MDVRAMFANHVEDEVLRVAGSEGGMMKLAAEYVEMRASLDEAEINVQELTAEVVKLKNSLAMSLSAVGTTREEASKAQLEMDRMIDQMMELEVKYERTKDLRQEMEALIREKAKVEKENEGAMGQVSNMAKVVGGQVAQIEELQKRIAEQERVVAQAKMMSDEGDKLMAERLELKDQILMLERERREALFSSDRLEKECQGLRKFQEAELLRKSSMITAGTDPLPPPPPSPVAALVESVVSHTLPPLPDSVTAVFCRGDAKPGSVQEMVKWVCPARPTRAPALASGEWRLDSWGESKAEEISKSRGIPKRRKSIVVGGDDLSPADLSAAVEWVLAVSHRFFCRLPRKVDLSFSLAARSVSSPPAFVLWCRRGGPERRWALLDRCA